jgi:hypothetical protein
MGFFKKIGGFVKKATKQVSFKNLVKVGGMLDPTGLVSGMQNAHYEKKALQEQAKAESDAIAQAQAQARNPNIGEILTGAAGGALSGAGNVLAGSTSAGQTGATLVDNTLSTWFKQNWLKVFGAVTGVTLLIILIVKLTKKNHSTSRRR